MLGLALGIWQLTRTTDAEERSLQLPRRLSLKQRRCRSRKQRRLLPPPAPRPQDVAEMLVEKVGMTNTESAFSSAVLAVGRQVHAERRPALRPGEASKDSSACISKAPGASCAP